MISRMAEKIHKIHAFHQNHHGSQPSQSSPSSSSLAPSITTTRTSLSDEFDSPTSKQSFPPIPQVQMTEHHLPLGNVHPSFKLSDFAIQRTLGTGSFGRVHLGRHRESLRFYAIKVLSKEKVVRTKQVEHTKNERRLLQDVHNPFIVTVWGAFQDSANLYMVQDFVAGGELFTLLRKAKRFPDPVAKFYAAEVALALHYLHGKDIIYRDLKPENILLGQDGHIKLTDFGFAKIVRDVTWTLCGTPDYLAPEVVAQGCYNKSVDWYALGILIFEMLAGYPPFHSEDPNPIELYRRIQAGIVQYPNGLSPNAIDLIKCFLRSDLSERYGNMNHGTEDIFAHAWFAEVIWDKLYMKEVPAPFIPNIHGEGDSSAFDSYQETDIRTYGLPGPDPHGHLFNDFDYTF
ncbi:AGC/PKA protein kinase [Hysterangium stoloniferum]|nr:AGC/PKA protein kinase [Hysterangium stoloniferum]